MSSARWHTLLLSLILLTIVLPAWWLARDYFRTELMAEQRAKAAAQLTTYANATNQAAQRRFDLLEDLQAFVAAEAEADELGAEAESFIRALMVSHGGCGIQGFLIAPGGVSRYVYPPAGNEDLLGRNLYEDLPAGARADVQRALATRSITLSGPEDLGAETPGWIAWLAVGRAGEPWGLVAVRLDPVEVLSEVETDGVPYALELGLRDHTGRILHGGETVFTADPVLAQVTIPDGHLELAGVPVGGWEQAIAATLGRLSATALVAAVLLFLLIYTVANRQINLAAAVEERTREIAAMNAVLRADLAKRRQLEAERETLLAQLEQRVNERTHHLAALYDVTSVASSSLDLKAILERSLLRILSVAGCDMGLVRLVDGEGQALRLAAAHGFGPEGFTPAESLPSDQGLVGLVFSQDQTLVVNNVAADERAAGCLNALDGQAYAAVPIRARGQRLGVLGVLRPRERPFDAEETALLAAIGDQLGVAVENARLYAASQEKAVLEERQRLARDLHDSVTQLIYSLGLMSETGLRHCDRGDYGRVREHLGRLAETAQQALREMRLLVYELRPLAFDGVRLVDLLRQRLDAVERRAGVRVELKVEGSLDVPAAVREGLFRITQEALNNALKHAAAAAVAVRLRLSEGLAELTVQDDGHGFDPVEARMAGGMGLASMRERVEALGGSLWIDSQPARGTAIHVRVPLTRLAGEQRATRAVSSHV